MPLRARAPVPPPCNIMAPRKRPRKPKPPRGHYTVHAGMREARARRRSSKTCPEHLRTAHC
eukprot:scaffold210858_cov24-Tisochrysis_lutea.AAC.1